jgi:hypothetical protein
VDGAEAIVPWFLLTAGILAAVALFIIWRSVLFHRRAVETTGTVVAYQTSSSSEGGLTYQPVIEFRTAEGRMVRFTDRMGSNPPRYEQGMVIPVKYDPKKPTKAKPGGAFRTVFTPALLLGLAAVFGGIAVAVA